MWCVNGRLAFCWRTADGRGYDPEGLTRHPETPRYRGLPETMIVKARHEAIQFPDAEGEVMPGDTYWQPVMVIQRQRLIKNGRSGKGANDG